MRFQKQKFLLIFCLSLALFSFLSVPHFASARGLVPCGGYTDSGSLERVCNVEDIFVLVARVTNWLIAVAGIYAVYVIINQGFWLIVSMGNEEAITKRKTALSNAVVGFVIVMMAFMTINWVVNVLITRSLVTAGNKNCVLNLASPLTYLNIDPNQCSNLPDSQIQKNNPIN